MNNNRHTAKEIREAFDHLPKTVRDVIMSDNVDSAIKSISQKYNLRIDQAAQLEDEITYVMYGLERPESFIQNLMNEARLDQAIAVNISKDVETKIFQAIKSDLMHMHDPNYEPQIVDDKEPTYQETVLKRYRDAEARDDVEEMLEIKKNIFSGAQPSDNIEDLIKYMDYNPNAPKPDELPPANQVNNANTIDLRTKQDNTYSVPVQQSPRDNEPKLEYRETPQPNVPPVVNPNAGNKKRPSDGVKQDEYREEVLSFPYKPEDHQPVEEGEVAIDLDEYEPKPQSVPGVKVPEDANRVVEPEQKEVAPPAPTPVDEKIETPVTNIPKPQLNNPISNQQVSDDVTEEEIQNEEPESGDDIITKNMTGNISKSEITEVDTQGFSLKKPDTQYKSSPDPYREPIE